MLSNQKKFTNYDAAINSRDFKNKNFVLKVLKQKENFAILENQTSSQLMKSFSIDFKENMKTYQDIRKENDEFLKKYKMSKENHLKKDITHKHKSSFQSTFVDLISIYKKKGYKIPDLSLKNKLFDPSSLLMENNKIIEYSKLMENNKDFKKDIVFLQKLYHQCSEFINKDDEHSSRNSNISLIQLHTARNNSVDRKSLLKEISQTERYIDKVKTSLEKKEFREIFEKEISFNHSRTISRNLKKKNQKKTKIWKDKKNSSSDLRFNVKNRLNIKIENSPTISTFYPQTTFSTKNSTMNIFSDPKKSKKEFLNYFHSKKCKKPTKFSSSQLDYIKIEEEKDKILFNIKESLKSRNNKKLNSIYEKTTNRKDTSEINELVIDYLSQNQNTDKPMFVEGMKRKNFL